mmetsp:Transcript_28520/g.42145  ORF Transcript_28520/g.42145 Transcript_28520/m.42145 type:complete len:205 (-) Transcript_28520:2611-3225(-)
MTDFHCTRRRSTISIMASLVAFFWLVPNRENRGRKSLELATISSLAKRSVSSLPTFCFNSFQVLQSRNKLSISTLSSSVPIEVKESSRSSFIFISESRNTLASRIISDTIANLQALITLSDLLFRIASTNKAILISCAIASAIDIIIPSLFICSGSDVHFPKTHVAEFKVLQNPCRTVKIVRLRFRIPFFSVSKSRSAEYSTVY